VRVVAHWWSAALRAVVLLLCIFHWSSPQLPIILNWWSPFSIGSLYEFWTYAWVVRLFQLFSKAVKQVGDKSLQFCPPICYFFSNLESPLYLCVCNKLWREIETIGNSHSASSQLSGEFTLLHAIHTLANLALKQTVPPQSRTSPHVTVKNIYSVQRIQGKRKLLKNPECKKYIEYSENFQGKPCISL